MSGVRFIDHIGCRTGAAVAMSWIPPGAAHAYLGTARAADPAEDLADLAVALRVDLAFVPAGEPWSPVCARALRREGVAVGWAVPGPLGLVAEALGLVEVLKLSVGEPGSLAVPLADALHRTSEFVRVGAAAGADVIVCADDLAADSGWLVSPDFALSALVPCIAHVASEARRLGMPTVQHSDGDIRAVFGALRDAGVAGIHVGSLSAGAFPSIMGAAKATDLGVLGGLAVRDLCADDRVSAGVRGLVAGLVSLAADGDLLVCDDGGITTAGQLGCLAAALAEVRRALSS